MIKAKICKSEDKPLHVAKVTNVDTNKQKKEEDEWLENISRTYKIYKGKLRDDIKYITRNPFTYVDNNNNIRHAVLGMSATSKVYDFGVEEFKCFAVFEIHPKTKTGVKLTDEYFHDEYRREALRVACNRNTPNGPTLANRMPGHGNEKKDNMQSKRMSGRWVAGLHGNGFVCIMKADLTGGGGANTGKGNAKSLCSIDDDEGEDARELGEILGTNRNTNKQPEQENHYVIVVCTSTPISKEISEKITRSMSASQGVVKSESADADILTVKNHIHSKDYIYAFDVSVRNASRVAYNVAHALDLVVEAEADKNAAYDKGQKPPMKAIPVYHTVYNIYSETSDPETVEFYIGMDSKMVLGKDRNPSTIRFLLTSPNGGMYMLEKETGFASPTPIGIGKHETQEAQSNNILSEYKSHFTGNDFKSNPNTGIVDWDTQSIYNSALKKYISQGWRMKSYVHGLQISQCTRFLNVLSYVSEDNTITTK